ncbi:MAG: adenosylcobinamide-GDP ribazoletransferase [Magnetovibrio sp.]|nr:adenosylcobinamide-GDP ribazoletransferase [Magnetovibrio sp.]|tara:strand:+ start:1241 stop:2023 length:783 start_codon:yes stop_codon:yes gene_type:complete
MVDKSYLITAWLKDQADEFAIACSFLTRLPVRQSRLPHTVELSHTIHFFPIVGLLIGGLSGGAVWLTAQTGLQPLACAFVGLLVGAWITGALHEDGLADLADGLGGNTRERKLEIMRDPNIGTFGMLTLILLIGLKASILSQLCEEEVAWSSIVVAATLSRSVMTPCMSMIAPARTDGLGYNSGRPTAKNTWKGLILGSTISIVFLGLISSLLIVAVAVAIMALIIWLAHSKLGGYTGDVLGAIQQTAEVSILCVIGVLL